MSEHVAVSPGPARFLLPFVAGAVALVIGGFAIVLTAGRAAAPAPADPASPVGVVQAYASAIQAGDAERAYGYLSQSAQRTRPFERYRSSFSNSGRSSDTQRRLLIEPVSEGPDRAEVKVTISTFAVHGGPLSSSTYHRDVTVRLVKEADVWRIDQPLEPYSLS